MLDYVSVGAEAQANFKGSYAIVFVDFRAQPTRFCSLRPAEELRRMSHAADLGRGSVVLSRLFGSLSDKLTDSVELITLPRELR